MDDGKRTGAGGDATRAEYEATLILERLESLVEEMDEMGIATRTAAEPYSDLREEMDDLGIGSRPEAIERIAELRERLDGDFG